MCNGQLKPIQIRLFENTIEKVKILAKWTKEKNKTQVVATAIHIYFIICKVIFLEKATVIIKYPGVKQEKLIIPGLTKE
jgi:hypothetical protein